jgi:arsenate reductase (thioredoxin)
VSVTRKYKVLFLCRENAARSIIAEALLRELAGHRFEAFSAGPEPAPRVHPLAVAQLRPGISDCGALSPKSWLEFTGEWAPRMDLVITMDAFVGELPTPDFPGDPALRNWTFADPLADGVNETERVRLFEKVFWQIVRQVSGFIELPQHALPMQDTVPLTEAAMSGSGMQLDVPGTAQTFAKRLDGQVGERLDDVGHDCCSDHRGSSDHGAGCVNAAGA